MHAILILREQKGTEENRMNQDYIYGKRDGELSKRLVRKIHKNWSKQHPNASYLKGYIAGLGYTIRWDGKQYVA